MPSKRRKPEKRSFMCPSLHDEVSAALEEHDLLFGFNPNGNGRGFISEYSTNIMGRFECNNSACSSTGWSSKQVAITIRLYSGDRYDTTVFNQRCKSCKQLGEPHIDADLYVERVTYRIKKWRNIRAEKPFYSGQKKGPHRRELCEGCKAGQCSVEVNDLAEQMEGWLVF